MPFPHFVISDSDVRTVPADIVVLARQVFGGDAGAESFLSAPHRALDNRTPAEVANFDPEKVTYLLRAILYGLPA